MSGRGVTEPRRTKRALVAAIAIVAGVGIGCSTSPSAREGFAAVPTDAATDASPVDLGSAFGLDGGEAGSFADVVAPGTDCARKLQVGKLSVSNGRCFVNEHVTDQTTTLRFPCAGGTAEATFGSHAFRGTVNGDVVVLKDVEPFLYKQCQWESTETIDGNLAKGSVVYSYSERPLQSCTDSPCSASGSLAVTAGDVVVIK